MLNMAPFEIALVALLVAVEFGVCALPILRRRSREAAAQEVRISESVMIDKT